MFKVIFVHISRKDDKISEIFLFLTLPRMFFCLKFEFFFFLPLGNVKKRRTLQISGESNISTSVE